jgi:hypothetical protein
MDLIPRLLLAILGAMILAGVLYAVSGAFTGEGRSRRITDADVDGEPDETPSEKARALNGPDTECSRKPGLPLPVDDTDVYGPELDHVGQPVETSTTSG